MFEKLLSKINKKPQLQIKPVAEEDKFHGFVAQVKKLSNNSFAKVLHVEYTDGQYEKITSSEIPEFNKHQRGNELIYINKDQIKIYVGEKCDEVYVERQNVKKFRIECITPVVGVKYIASVKVFSVIYEHNFETEVNYIKNGFNFIDQNFNESDNQKGFDTQEEASDFIVQRRKQYTQEFFKEDITYCV